MNDKLITSDQPLTADQQNILTAIVDTMVPASDDGTMPSAGELNFTNYLHEFAPEFLANLPHIIAMFAEEFPNEEIGARYHTLKTYSEDEPEMFRQLLALVYGCYYQEDRVLEAIGVGKGAPFPRGNEVEPGDLSLLEPVMQSEITWRR